MFFIDQRIHYNTLRINSPVGTGTGFLVEINNTVFIFTTAHCVRETREGDKILVRNSDSWKTIGVEKIGFHPNGYDCAVIKTSHRPRGGLGEEDFEKRVAQGQNLAYCGFPLGLEIQNDPQLSTFPVAFVKSGDVSGWLDMKNGERRYYIDSYGNPGFSGGPVVGQNQFGKKKIYGVVTSGQYEPPHPILEKAIDGKFQYSSLHFDQRQGGFTVFVPIEHHRIVATQILDGTQSREPVKL